MIFCIFIFSFIAAVMSCLTFWHVTRSESKTKADPVIKEEAASAQDETLDAFEKRYANAMNNILSYEFKDARKAVNAYGEDE